MKASEENRLVAARPAGANGHQSFFLASGSPRRSELLRFLGIPFEVRTPQVVENESSQGDVTALVRENARTKAAAVARDAPDSLVLAADTVVTLGGRILHKPADLVEADQMLTLLSGKTHEVLTGLALQLPGGGRLEHVETSRVRFRELRRQDIADYLEAVHVLDKAGSYAIQEQGDLLVDQYEGSFTNIIGLPLTVVADWLKQHTHYTPYAWQEPNPFRDNGFILPSLPTR